MSFNKLGIDVSTKFFFQKNEIITIDGAAERESRPAGTCGRLCKSARKAALVKRNENVIESWLKLIEWEREVERKKKKDELMGIGSDLWRKGWWKSGANLHTGWISICEQEGLMASSPFHHGARGIHLNWCDVGPKHRHGIMQIMWCYANEFPSPDLPRSPPISPDVPRIFQFPWRVTLVAFVSQSFILGCNDNMQMSCLHPDSPNRHLTARPAFQFTFNGRNNSVSSIRGQILIPIDGPSSIQQSSFSINHNLFGGKAPLMTSSYLMTSWSHHGKCDSILCQCGRPLAWRHGRIFFRTMERRQRWIFNWFSADSRVDL